MATLNRRMVLAGLVAASGIAAAPGFAAAGGADATRAGAPAIVVRTTENVTGGTWVWLLKAARQAGVGRIYLLVKQDENNYASAATGRTLRSGEMLAPVAGGATAAGWDDPTWLDEMLAAARAAGVEIHAWWPCFQDAAGAAELPGAAYAGRGEDVFLDPASPEVRAYQRGLLDAFLDRYGFDGVALDWLRYNDRADGSAGPLAGRFKDLTGRDWSKEAMADPLARALWDDLRARTVADWVEGLLAEQRPLRPGLHWSAFVLPWQFKEVAQSYRHLSAAGLDALQPMIYWRDWKEDVAFAADVVGPAQFQLSGRTTLDPTFDITEDPGHLAEALAFLPVDRLGRVTWYHHGVWTADDFAKIAALTAAAAASRKALYGETPATLVPFPLGQRLDPAAFPPGASVWALVCLGELHRRKALEGAEPVVPVLGLHRFHEGALESGPSDWHNSTAFLDTLIARIAADGFATIPAKTLAAYVTSEDRKILPERPLVITIDDGSASVAALFEPRAAAAGLAYSAAIVTSWMSDETGQIIDVGEGLTDVNLTWQQAETLHRTGRVGFISHSHAQHHYGRGGVDGAEHGPAITTRLWIDAEARRESDAERLRRVHGDFVDSRSALARRFGQASTLMAWPYGMHDDAAEAAALDAGFTHFFEFGGGAFAAPREKPRRILRLAVTLMDEAVPTNFPADPVIQQRWWLAFLRMARASKSIDLIDAALAQLEEAQAGHPEAELSRAAKFVLNGHAALGARLTAQLRGAYPHDGTVHGPADEFEAAYGGLL